jgi:isoleucyl-tRNA synthetase
VLYRITHAMLRLMAPFLSFTAEEAWQAFGTSESIFMETFSDLGTPNEALLAKWARIREIRDQVNKDIETLRADGKVGASLQASVNLQVGPEDHALLASLGHDLKFVFITSQLNLETGSEMVAKVFVSQDTKCERCWHYAPDVGVNPAHPTLCGRCDSNLHGAGETRLIA